MTANAIAIAIMVIAIITMSILDSSNRTSVGGCRANTNMGSASSSAIVGSDKNLSIECSVSHGVNTTVDDSNDG